MNKASSFTQFTGKYSLSKTLRFELKPVGKTLENIEAKGLISQDKQRAESYKKMKETIDKFHRHFIEIAMKQVSLGNLSEYQELYNATPEKKKEDSFQNEWKAIQTILRKQIVQGFSSGEAKEIMAQIGKKELITKLLEDWIAQQEEEIYFDSEFKTFTTYFGGFHENRQNMYTDKEQSTAIAYRLIHENLPKFLDNMKIFERLKAMPELHEKCDVLYSEIEEYLNITKIDEAFELEYYNEVLTQRQIEVYNLIVGGRTAGESGKKIQGLNEYINLYNQQQKEKSNKIPKLKILYKQILSDRESTSYLPDAFEDSSEVLEAIELFYKVHLIDFNTPEKDETVNVLEEIKTLLGQLPEHDTNKIYLKNDTSLTNISQRLFGSYAVCKDALQHYYATVEQPDFESKYEKADEKKRETLDKAQEKFTKQPFVSISLLQKALDGYVATLDKNHEIRDSYSETCVADYFHTHFIAKMDNEKDKTFDFISNIDAKFSAIKGILGQGYHSEIPLHQNKDVIGKIKDFLDAIMELVHFVKPLGLPNDSVLEKDEQFYSHFEQWNKQLQLIIPLYNKVRNYATQKAYSIQKFKLNFENKNDFLGGWVDSKTNNSDNGTQSGGYLFRKKNSLQEYDYYLGVSKDSKLFRSFLQNDISCDDLSEFERLDYYQLKSASIYGNSYLSDNTYSEDKTALIEAIYSFASKHPELISQIDSYLDVKSATNQPTPSGIISIIKDSHLDLLDLLLQDGNFNSINSTVIENLRKTILSLKRVPKSQTFKDAPFKLFTEPMEVIEDLCTEKVFNYFAVSQSEMQNAIQRDQKPLFLFQIINKDLTFAKSYEQGNRKARGRDNLHTMYFRQLMSGNQNVLDIGTGEIFFREKSLTYDSKVWKEGHHRDQLKSTFDYPIISNRRFAVDKFHFHLSMKMNYQKPEKPKTFNQDVLSFLKNNPDVNIIGLDRGERHLIYLTLINQKGEILQQESLNTVVNTTHNIETKYHELLDKREGDRDKARKEWGTIENIKELKEGYLSQVVHKIARMMVEHNAIVVMENLNSGFKRGRFKVEKQIYQKLEKMLIDKLNYLVFKDQDPQETAGLYKALQLTNKFKSFKDLREQSGFLFYVPAWNTSKIDPTTGFVNLFDTRYENVEKAKAFFQKFDSIRFNSESDYFEFEFDYSKFTTRADGTQTDWKICTYGERILTFRNPEQVNKWDNKEVVLTKEFKSFFEEKGIDFNSELKEQICARDDKDFFKGLLHLFKLTLQMRNSITNSEVDYLISPVQNSSGNFYDSRKADSTQPKDADANGAYHIAKKGLWVLQQINQHESDDWKKLKLAISNKEWLQFVQEK